MSEINDDFENQLKELAISWDKSAEEAGIEAQNFKALGAYFAKIKPNADAAKAYKAAEEAALKSFKAITIAAELVRIIKETRLNAIIKKRKI